MNGPRFDELARTLATGNSRRRLLKGLLGGALGAVGLREAAAACPHPEVACSGNCVNLRTDPQNCGRCGRTCGEEQVCYAARCRISCPRGFDACGGTCVRACPGDLELNPETCACECPGDTELCDGVCTDTATDPNNCGDCGEICDSNEACVGGECAAQCAAAQEVCDTADDCCAGLECSGSSGTCCVSFLGSCTSSADCCGDLFCEGFCRPT